MAAVQKCLDSLEVQGLSLFARHWHGCSRIGPLPFPRVGPAILVANHTCHADAAFLVAACGRPLDFLQARERHDVLLLRQVFRLVGCIPISRGRSDIAAIRTALRRLRAGRAIGLFPEGEIAPAGWGRVAAGKHGAALLALRSRAPLFPARIWGGPQSRRLLTSWLLPASGVRVRIGPAINLSDYLGRKIDRKLLAIVTERIMDSIRALERFDCTTSHHGPYNCRGRGSLNRPEKVGGWGVPWRKS